jgi:glycosyltransferase 2 family protein
MGRSGRKRWGKRALKLVLGVLVLWVVGRHIARIYWDLRQHGGSVHVEAGWVAAAVALYLVGLCCNGVFYGLVVRRGQAQVPYLAALRAYLISHLGKYVPGKAMVVVIRAGLLAPYGARPATAAFAAIYETLVMMAAGGVLAALVFAHCPVAPLPLPLGRRRVMHVPLSWFSLAVGLAFLVPVEPRVFPRLSAVMSLPFPNVGPEALPRLSRGLLGAGLLWSLASWILLGLSQVAVIRALVPSPPWTTWPVVVASVALATVAGFAVAIFPGGLVIREGVLMATLAPLVGTDPAVLAALVLRLAWVIGEVLVTAALSVLRPPLPRLAE